MSAKQLIIIGPGKGWSLVFLALATTSWFSIAAADDDGKKPRRAVPPRFAPERTDGIFFDRLDDALTGVRPKLTELRSVAASPNPTSLAADTSDASTGRDTGGGIWSKRASAQAIEDEVKRVRLLYDATVTTPGQFKGGGYQDARVHLSVLAMLFAVVSEYDGEIRWKEEAVAARDLIARTAFNCKAGSTQVYNEAKLRKADLQDLVSGAGLSGRDATAPNDWAMIADRSPLMEYAESVLGTLEDASRNASAVEAGTGNLKRGTEMIALLGEVLTRDGMDEADDEDYVLLSREMTAAATDARQAVESGDPDAIRQRISVIGQSCNRCHEQYR